MNALYKKFTEFKDYYKECENKNNILPPAGSNNFKSYLQSIVGTLINTTPPLNIDETIKTALKNLAVLLGTVDPTDILPDPTERFQLLLKDINKDTDTNTFLTTIINDSDLKITDGRPPQYLTILGKLWDTTPRNALSRNFFEV